MIPFDDESEVIYAANSIADLETWLSDQPANTADTAYRIELNIYDISTLKTILSAVNKYVYLDLSGSTFTSIGAFAFYECTKLTGIIIPDSVTSIGQSAFSDCRNLIEITIPNGVTSIGLFAFLGCNRLVGITIPDSVIGVIEGLTFFDCTSLISVNIGSGVTGIASEAFEGCTNLNNITLYYNPAMTTIRSFRNYLKNVIVPDSVTNIAATIFQNCTNLTNVTIGSGVTGIADNAFQGCTGLTCVMFQGIISSSSFSSCNPFPGDLRDKYLEGGIGTYTRPDGESTIWTKQP